MDYVVTFCERGHWETFKYDILTEAENEYMEMLPSCNRFGFLLQLIDQKRKKRLAHNWED